MICQRVMYTLKGIYPWIFGKNLPHGGLVKVNGHIVQVRAALREQDRHRLDSRHLVILRRGLESEVYGWTGKEQWYKGQKLVCFISPALPDMQTIPSLCSEMASGWNGPAFMLLFLVLQSLAKRWGGSKSRVGEHDINTPVQLFFPLKQLCDKF